MSRRGMHPLLMGVDKPERNIEDKNDSGLRAMSPLSTDASCAPRQKNQSPRKSPDETLGTMWVMRSAQTHHTVGSSTSATRNRVGVFGSLAPPST